MADHLTDEQVAELVDECAYHDGNGWRTLPEFVEALAREVQQARQRRCVNCREYQTDGEEWQWCPRITCHVTEDWFCADFAPKEAR